MTRLTTTLPRSLAGPVALVAAVLVLPAALEAAPRHVVAKTVTHVVAVTNHRASPVTTLVFTADDEAKAPANMLKTPLKQGETRKVSVRANQGVCSFAVSGAFEDGTDIAGSGLDLCKDHTLALVD